MHILVVTTYSDRSESAVYRGLVASGEKVSMVCHPQAPERAALEDAGIRVCPLRIRNRLDLLSVLRLRRILFQTYPDVIYAPRNGSLSVALLASRGLPARVVAYRGTIGHLSRFDPASWLTYFHPRVARINCVSNAVREYLIGCNLDPSKLVTIYKGHDIRWYETGQPPPLSEFGIPDGAFTIGFTGTIRPVKGVDVLIKAFRELPRSLNAHLLLVGQLSDARVRRQLQDPALADRVHCTGFRKDAAMLAKAVDVFVMPSLEREGLPRAVVEAMAQGVPVVVSAVGGLPELVIHDESGILTPPGDAFALTSALLRLARSPELRQSLGNAARERIIAHFDIRSTTEQMRELFANSAG